MSGSGTRLLLCLWLACVGAQCADGAGTEPRAAPGAGPAAAPGAAPPGVVLRVEGLDVHADEVDALAALVGELYPEYTLNHCRRLALSEVVLPRAAARAARPAEREAALERARAAQADLPAFDGDPGWDAAHDARVYRLRGVWTRVGGLDLWGFARSLEPQAWGGPFERIGTFELVRLRLREPAATPAQEVLEIDLVTFPYLPEGTTPAELDALIDDAELEIVDPAWEEIVPESFQYRMRGVPR